uniref:Uncharacterized protein n=1 Tax=Tanacetum cinerariifolium TaxID=118510 RepID=A0A6L2MQB2_TANCI|nr:hypothetical protein [Tanacetum cinerariifolium]
MLHKTTLEAKAKENIAKVQEKIDEEEIEKMVEGKEDEESYASAFADSASNDDVDDTGRRCKDYERKTIDENLEKIDKVVKEKEIQEVLDTFNQMVPDLNFAKTNEIIKEEMPRLIKLAVNKDREATPVNIAAMVTKEFATHGPK